VVLYRFCFQKLNVFIHVVHKEKKAIQEDFEESFAGLDDTKQEHSSSSLPHQVVEETEIQTADQREVESMEQDHDAFLDSLGADPGEAAVKVSFLDEVPEKIRKEVVYQQPEKETKTVTVIERDYQRMIAENTFITSPPKQGRLVVLSIMYSPP
jgi:hypothetical protein